MGIRIEWPSFLPGNNGDGNLINWDDGALKRTATAAASIWGGASMFGGGGAAGGAGASNAAGSAGTNYMPWLLGAQFAGNMYANDQNMRNADNVMHFQERMSSTSHQREVEDLRLAGLNPILSANGGAPGASGASATIGNPAEGLMSNAMEATMLKGALAKQGLENNNLEASNALLRSQKNKTDTETRALRSDAEKSDFFGKLWNKLNSMHDTGAKMPSFYDQLKRDTDRIQQRKGLK